jgi:hypothetical protein
MIDFKKAIDNNTIALTRLCEKFDEWKRGLTHDLLQCRKGTY